ncbi:S8 family serine peptidase [Dactylosporangium sp. NPDC049140]|uniref:S8 family serine peptidase n=1 Tax=Dactylosporangium sp. NPDC049140 TaxID=3155647 RepID=UPI0033D04BAC
MILRRIALPLAVTVLAAVAVPVPAVADTVRDQQWHLDFMHVTEAQRISQGEGVLVAVADTGVEASVPELAGAVIPGKDFGGNTGDGRHDPQGHGTAMAALIAGRGRGGDKGVLGIAPKATILPIQLSPDFDFAMGYARDVAAAIDYAVSQGAKVICLSVGSGDNQSVRAAIQKALDADVVVVAAAGNKPDVGSVDFPARVPGVVAVGAVDRNGERAAISVAGPELTLVAPGVDIAAVDAAGRTRTGTGTSDANALVVGAVALIRARYPQLKGPDVVRRLTETALDKGEPGKDPVYGYGVIDLVKALTADVPPALTSASPSPSAAPGNGGSGRTAAVIAAIGAAVVVMVFIAVLQTILRGRRRRP